MAHGGGSVAGNSPWWGLRNRSTMRFPADTASPPIATGSPSGKILLPVFGVRLSRICSRKSLPEREFRRAAGDNAGIPPSTHQNHRLLTSLVVVYQIPHSPPCKSLEKSPWPPRQDHRIGLTGIIPTHGPGAGCRSTDPREDTQRKHPSLLAPSRHRSGRWRLQAEPRYSRRVARPVCQASRHSSENAMVFLASDKNRSQRRRIRQGGSARL